MNKISLVLAIAIVVGPTVSMAGPGDSSYYYQRNASTYRYSLFDGATGSIDRAGFFSPRKRIEAEVAASYSSLYGESRTTVDHTSRKIERGSGERGTFHMFIMNAFSKTLGITLPNIDVGYYYEMGRGAEKDSTKTGRLDLFMAQTNALSVRILGPHLHTTALYLKTGYTSLSGSGLSDAGEAHTLRMRGGEADLYLTQRIGLNASAIRAENKDSDIQFLNNTYTSFFHYSFWRLGLGYDQVEIHRGEIEIKKESGLLSMGVVL